MPARPKFQRLEKFYFPVPTSGKTFFAALLLASSVGAQTYDIRDIGTLGGANSRAYGVNAAGWVVGEAETTNGLVHAFLWKPEQGLTDLGTLGGDISRAYAVNDRGMVVGEAENSEGNLLAFVWTAQAGLTNLALPKGVRESYAYGINNYGTVAGAGDLEEGTRALVWTVDGPGTPPALASNGSSMAYAVNDFGDLAGQGETGEPGAFISRAFFLSATGVLQQVGLCTGEWSSAALAINQEGVCAGFAEFAGATHAVLFQPTNGWQDLDTLDSVYSVAYGLNRQRHAVGLFVASHEDEDRAFFWSDGHMVDVNERVESEEPWLLVEARALNDAGQIVGYGLRNERERAFLLTPRPGATGDSARVAITSPERGTRKRFFEDEPAELEASTSEMEGVYRITFFANGTVLGSTTSSPFRLTWTPPTAGSFDLVVAAADRQGRVRRSPRVRMEVLSGRRPKPAVVILEPEDGTALEIGSNVLLYAEARVDNGDPAVVILQVNDLPVASETNGSATLLWTAPTSGLFTVTAVSETEDGLRATSRPARINVSGPDDAAP